MSFTPNRRSFIRGFAVAGLAGVVGLRPSFASALAEPQGKVILTMSGKIANTNKDGTAQFDMAMLEKLGTQSFETVTPWYDGKVKFEGVPMATLMDFVGANGTSITVKALNDYATDIPMDDFKKYPVILASKRDGNYMPVRDKGPLFIVYPYDSDPDLKHQRFYSRSAWQVAQIIVK
ncbi:MAG: twin-arginine translocation signal domain-containing protein [Alphaproteobacteria bacterium]|nr:twin-arginine translocation signal domain-containing protein [Alphaproteobacteria bacterium]